MSKKLIIISLIIGILIFGIIGFFLLEDKEAKKVSLEKKVTEQKIETEEVLKIAVSAMISPKKTLNIYSDLLDYIVEKLGKRVEMVQRETYAEVNELLKDKKIVAAFVCSGPYVDGYKEFGMELLVTPQMYGETVYYSYIIVSEDSPIKSFNELRGKKFAFTDPKSNTGKLVPTYILSKMGETPGSFFEEYIYTGSHDNSIELVANKLVDGAAVDHLIYEYMKDKNPSFVKGIKVIEKHGPYGIPPFVVHPDMDSKMKEQIKMILLEMDKDPNGKKIIQTIMIDKFVEVKDSIYDSVREMRVWEEKAQNSK